MPHEDVEPDDGGHDEGPWWQRAFLFFIVRYEVIAIVVLVTLAVVLFIFDR